MKGDELLQDPRLRVLLLAVVVEVPVLVVEAVLVDAPVFEVAAVEEEHASVEGDVVAGAAAGAAAGTVEDAPVADPFTPADARAA